MNDLHTIWEKQDCIDEWMQLYVDDDHPAWTDDKHILVVSHVKFKSKDDILTSFRDMLVDRTTQVTMKNESVAVLSKDIAIHFGDFSYTITRDGKTSVPHLASATTVWVKDGGTWKILHYHQSWPYNKPLAAMDS